MPGRYRLNEEIWEASDVIQKEWEALRSEVCVGARSENLQQSYEAQLRGARLFGICFPMYFDRLLPEMKAEILTWVRAPFPIKQCPRCGGSLSGQQKLRTCSRCNATWDMTVVQK